LAACRWRRGHLANARHAQTARAERDRDGIDAYACGDPTIAPEDQVPAHRLFLRRKQIGVEALETWTGRLMRGKRRVQEIEQFRAVCDARGFECTLRHLIQVCLLI
jgi:hypothetical protein